MEHVAQESRKRWFELSRRKRTIALVIVELIVTTIALRDLTRRQAASIRGGRRFWLVACCVQPIGPPLYLALGRRRRGR